MAADSGVIRAKCPKCLCLELIDVVDKSDFRDAVVVCRKCGHEYPLFE